MKPLLAAQSNMRSYIALRAPYATAYELRLLTEIDTDIDVAIRAEHDRQTALETLSGQLQSALATPMTKRRIAR